MRFAGRVNPHSILAYTGICSVVSLRLFPSFCALPPAARLQRSRRRVAALMQRCCSHPGYPAPPLTLASPDASPVRGCPLKILLVDLVIAVCQHPFDRT